MKKTDTWRGYSRQELAQAREVALQSMRSEINTMDAGIQTARQNNIFKTVDMVRRILSVVGYFGIFKFVFKIFRLLRKFKF